MGIFRRNKDKVGELEQVILEHADAAYEWFKSERDIFTVYENKEAMERSRQLLKSVSDLNVSQWGPFPLKVPKLDGKTVYVCGRPHHMTGDYEPMHNSLRRFYDKCRK